MLIISWASLERKAHRISTYQAKVLYSAATHSSLWWGFQWDYLEQTVLLLLTVHMSALKSLRTETDQLHSLSILLHHLQLLKKKIIIIMFKGCSYQLFRNSYPLPPDSSFYYIPVNIFTLKFRIKSAQVDILYTNTPKSYSLT